MAHPQPQVDYRSPRIPTQNEYFQCKPHQVYALRKAMKWTLGDLAAFCGCSMWTINEWIRGRSVPLPFHRQKLTSLAELFREEYEAALAAIPDDLNVSTLLVPIKQQIMRDTSSGRRYRKRLTGYLRITPEVRKKLNEGHIWVAPLSKSAWFLAGPAGSAKPAPKKAR